MRDQAKSMEPEEVTRLVMERLNAGDAAGVAALYEPEAVLAYPADRPTTGRAAIQAAYQRMVDAGMRFGVEAPLPTVRFQNLALTSTRSADNTGVRVQVLRRQPDGSWLRIIDRPESHRHSSWSGIDTRQMTISGFELAIPCGSRCPGDRLLRDSGALAVGGSPGGGTPISRGGRPPLGARRVRAAGLGYLSEDC